MKTQIFSLCIFACAACAFDIDDTLDRLDSTLTISGFQDNFRARVSGTVEIRDLDSGVGKILRVSGKIG